MIFARAAATGLLAMLASAAVVAETAVPVITPDVYLFHTYEKANGVPLCRESWDLLADGNMAVNSGAERVAKSWSLDGNTLVSTFISTNGKPDCTGQFSKGQAGDSSRTYLLPVNDGTYQTCPEPTIMPDGKRLFTGCYGRLVRASVAG